MSVVEVVKRAGDDFLERRDVAFERGQFFFAVCEHVFHCVDDQVFLKLHVHLVVVKGHFRLEHPELGEVAAGLRLFGAESGAEAVNFAEGHGRGFGIELPGLGQIGFLVEVIELEQSVGAFADGAGEDGAVHEHEAAVVKELAPAPDDLVADLHQRVLAAGAQPEMASIEQEIDAVVLLADRILFAGVLKDLQVGHGQLHAGRRAAVGTHDAGRFETGLEPEPFGGFELSVGNFALDHHALNGSRAVAKLEEVNLSRTALVVHPAFHADALACMIFQIFDVYPRCCHCHQPPTLNIFVR